MAASDAVDDVVDSLLMRVVCKRSLLASTFNVQFVSIYCIDLKKCCTFLIHYCYGYTFAEVVDNCIGVYFLSGNSVDCFTNVSLVTLVNHYICLWQHLTVGV